MNKILPRKATSCSNHTMGSQGVPNVQVYPKSTSKPLPVGRATLSGYRNACYFSKGRCPRCQTHCLATRWKRRKLARLEDLSPGPAQASPRKAQESVCTVSHITWGPLFSILTNQITVQSRRVVMSLTQGKALMWIATAVPPTKPVTSQDGNQTVLCTWSEGALVCESRQNQQTEPEQPQSCCHYS